VSDPKQRAIEAIDAALAALNKLPREMVPVFTVEVDRFDPHFIAIRIGQEGQRIANRYTLAGVMLDLVDEARANSAGHFATKRYEVGGQP